MSHLQPIFDAWDGNAEELASDINESGVTVRQWRRRNSIPSRYWQRIIEAAAKRGRTLSLEEFLPSDQPERAA